MIPDVSKWFGKCNCNCKIYPAPQNGRDIQVIQVFIQPPFFVPLNLAVSILHAIRLAARTRHSWQSGGCLATCLAHVSADAPVALAGHRNHLQCRHQRGSVSILISWGWLWYQGGRYNQSLRAVTTSLPLSFTRIDTVWYISRVHGFQFSR